jgi:hypothetical protein
MILRSSCSTRDADPGRKAGRCPNGTPEGGSLAVDFGFGFGLAVDDGGPWFWFWFGPFVEGEFGGGGRDCCMMDDG